MPIVFATCSRTPNGRCVPTYIVAPSLRTSATAALGPIGALAMGGSTYVCERRSAAARSRSSTPSSDLIGTSAVGPSTARASQSISRAAAAARACSSRSATTPTTSPWRTTSMTPGICRAASSLTARIFAPRTGGRAIAPRAIPGIRRSATNVARPVTMSRASRRDIARPEYRRRSSGIGATRSGTGPASGSESRRSPYATRLPLPTTMPASVSSCSLATPSFALAREMSS